MSMSAIMLRGNVASTDAVRVLRVVSASGLLASVPGSAAAHTSPDGCQVFCG